MMIKFFSKLFRKKDGSVAIEFSILVMPFIIISFSIIELSLMFAAESVLEGATNNAARVIRTGQLQQSGSEDLEQAFRDELCDHTPALVSCNDVLIEAQVMSSFSDYDTMAPSFDSDGVYESAGFAVGGSSERVLVRVAYYYSPMTPILLALFQSPGNTRLFMSTVVFQIEPYDFAAEIAEGGA